MELNNFETQFYENGFVVLKDSIEAEILEEAKVIMSASLSSRLGGDVDFRTGFLELLEREQQHDLQLSLYEDLAYHNFPLKVLRSPGVLEKLVRLLGPDLSCMEHTELTVNVKDVKDDYLVKKWHQEFWSGNGIHTVVFWFPISIEEDMGGVEFVPGSHHWGHIPHRNREPLEIPESAEFVIPQVSEGDGIMFHSLTLHRTAVNESPFPRFALPLSIKNFYHADSGVPEFKTWRPFNFSPLAMVHRKLGNSAFSPFRTFGSARADMGLNDLMGS